MAGFRRTAVTMFHVVASPSTMFRSLVAASLLAAASPLASQTIPAPEKIGELRDAALDGDHYAWDIVEGLTTEVGPRLAGTEAEARAREWAVKKLTSMGFANVRVEPFDMPVWVRGQESAEIVAPFPQRMVVAALGNSGSTGPEGITGEIVAFDSVDALRAAPDSAVRGKIVFVDHRMVGDFRRHWLRPVRCSAAPGPDPGQQEGRDRRSSSARSAPTITATRTLASRPSRTARRRSRRARCRCRMPNRWSVS